MRRILASLAVVAALTVTGVALGDGPAPPQPQPQPGLLSADGAQVAVVTGSASTGTTTQQVAPATVAAAMSTAGAVNFGDGPATSGALTVVAVTKCWAVNSGWTWGTWPYNQHLNSQAYWCARNGRISAISLTPTASSALCDSSATAGLVAGGIGQSSFVEQANGSWTCPTVVPWIKLHTHHWLQTWHNASGSSKQVAAG